MLSTTFFCALQCSENIISYAKAREIIEFSQFYSIGQLACECSAETQQKIILDFLKNQLYKCLK